MALASTPEAALLQWVDGGPVRATDPYLSWSECSGFQGHAALQRPGAQMPLLLKRRAHMSWERLSEEFGSNPLNPAESLFGTLWLRPDQLAAAREAFEALELSLPVDAQAPAAMPLQAKASPSGSQPVAEPCLIGVIDRGGAFLNASFRKGRKGVAAWHTRIRSYWDQSQAPRQGPWRAAAAGYGRELQAEQIDALLARLREGDADEAGLYRELGHLVNAQQQVMLRDHGSHVLDTLAGLPEPLRYASCAKPAGAPDAAACAPIVFVSVPDAAAQDSTCGPPMVYILDGIRHVLARAGAGCKVIINISLGVQAGPHDGSMLLEQAIDELLASRPDLNIVMAAGNGAQEPCNASGELLAGAPPARVLWRTWPGDYTDSFLEFWWSGEAAALGEAELRVRPPQGPPSPWLRLGRQMELRRGAQLLGRISLLPNNPGAPPQARQGARGLLALAPSVGPRGGGLAGGWLVELRRHPAPGATASAAGLRVETWVQGDQPVDLVGERMQSRLDEARTLSLGGAGSLNAIATGRLSLVVGATRLIDAEPTGYGSRGSARRGYARDIDLFACADEGVYATGLAATAVLSGTLVRMGGTSVAAPVAARQLFNLMNAMGRAEAGPMQIRAQLQRYAHGDAHRAPVSSKGGGAKTLVQAVEQVGQAVPPAGEGYVAVLARLTPSSDLGHTLGPPMQLS